MPSHESEALEGKQKLQMKTFSEFAECLARIPPKITLYGRLFKYNDVGRLLLLMFSTELRFQCEVWANMFAAFLRPSPTCRASDASETYKIILFP